MKHEEKINQYNWYIHKLLNNLDMSAVNEYNRAVYSGGVAQPSDLVLQSAQYAALKLLTAQPDVLQDVLDTQAKKASSYTTSREDFLQAVMSVYIPKVGTLPQILYEMKDLFTPEKYEQFYKIIHIDAGNKRMIKRKAEGYPNHHDIQKVYE